MIKMKNYSIKKEIKTVNGTVQAFKVDNDVNGNPRWVIHYLDLFNSYDNSERFKYGLKKYTAKWFGGGYVISSYNIEEEINDIVKGINSDKNE